MNTELDTASTGAPLVPRVAIIGTGYVGLTTGACLASIGSHVTCCDVDADKIDQLRAGTIPIVEDGLAEIVASSRSALCCRRT